VAEGGPITWPPTNVALLAAGPRADRGGPFLTAHMNNDRLEGLSPGGQDEKLSPPVLRQTFHGIEGSHMFGPTASESASTSTAPGGAGPAPRERESGQVGSAGGMCPVCGLTAGSWIWSDHEPPDPPTMCPFLSVHWTGGTAGTPPGPPDGRKNASIPSARLPRLDLPVSTGGRFGRAAPGPSCFETSLAGSGGTWVDLSHAHPDRARAGALRRVDEGWGN